MDDERKEILAGRLQEVRGEVARLQVAYKFYNLTLNILYRIKFSQSYKKYGLYVQLLKIILGASK